MDRSMMRDWLGNLSGRPRCSRSSSVRGSATTKTVQADADDIRYAYRLLLGREPDPEGFATYSRLIRTRSISAENLAETIMGSQEFLVRHDRSTTPAEVQLDGYSIFVRPIDHDIGQPILETHRYEPHVTHAVRELLRNGDTFVDVGANIGFFAALAASIVGEAGKVVAVEPMDKNVQLIHATVWRNGFHQIEILPYAASDARAQLPMTTGAGTSNGQVSRTGESRELPVLFAQAKRLDDLLTDLRRLDLLKIDIEGYELRALRGFESGLARHRPTLLTEFHPKCMRENAGTVPEEYLAFLIAYGSRVEILHHDGSCVVCADADAVMREWAHADHLLDSHGTTHIDLRVTPRV
jgi:FkbM family methyltransferase